LIEGGNGSGKTTILEALHYGCFLKSFRTNRAKDLVSFEQDNFFIQINFEEKQGDHNQIQIGVSFEENPKKQLVRFNKNVIKSYRDLIDRYRVVSLAESDLQLVQGAPEYRRYFLNQLLALFEPDFLSQLRKYRQILEHRNQVLMQAGGNGQSFHAELEVWSKQLWEQSILIQSKRAYYLAMLESEINSLLATQFSSLDLTIAFIYQPKCNITAKSFASFWKDYQVKKLTDELLWRRSLFGAHLDDFSIIFQEKKARYFASRGQQKLMLFLIKVAIVQQLESKGMHVSLLLDDFLTDFDNARLADCLTLLSKLSCQVFVTCPLKSLIIKHHQFGKKPTKSKDIQIISLP